MSSEVARLREALAEIRMLANDLVSDRTAEIAAIAEAALAQPEPTLDTRPALTPRQAEVLAFIRGHQLACGFPPSLREIGARFGIGSPNGVRSHLLALRRAGYLRWDATRSRTLSVVEVG